MNKAGVTCPRCGAVSERKGQKDSMVCRYCGYRFSDDLQQNRWKFTRVYSENGEKTGRETKMNRKYLFLTISLISLAAGTIIYLWLRPEAYVSQAVYIFLRIPAPALRLQGRVLKWINNYLPDILWAHALTYALLFLTGTEKKQIITAGILSICAEAATEILQRLELINGTFDLLDIAAEVITTNVVLLIIILISFFRRIKNEKAHH